MTEVYNSRAVTLPVAELVRETADSISILFDVPDEHSATFAYRPGQFLTLRVPSEQSGSVARCYSLASSPHTDSGLRVTVKRTADGYASNWLCDNLRVGDPVTMLPPGGVFTPKDLDADLLLFAGGSGITPILSIAKSALAEGSGSVHLIYANRDPDSVIFRAELNDLSIKYSDRFAVVHWLESVQGLPSAPALQALARPYAAAEAFVCGPAPFMAAVKEAVGAIAPAGTRLRSETFTSLAGDPFALAAAAVPTATVDDGSMEPTEPAEPTRTRGTVPIAIDLGGDTHRFDWPLETPLVDVLIERGLDSPFSCRDGECGSCQATVVSGRVNMLRNEVLAEEDVTDGYVLTCQAVAEPGSEPVHIQFP